MYKHLLVASLLLSCLFHKATAQTVDTSRAYIIVQQMPQFDGNLGVYIGTHLVYNPANAEAVCGSVEVSFIVERNGALSNIHAPKNQCPSLDSAAVTMVRNMPKWKPGTQNSIPVRVQYSLPIQFNAPVIEQNSVNPSTPVRVK